MRANMAESKVSVMVLVWLACMLGTACARPARVPLNSNFVNGPWSRIGKRAHPAEDTTRLCEAAASQIEQFDAHILFSYYVQCLRGRPWFRFDAEALLDASDGIYKRSPTLLFNPNPIHQTFISIVYFELEFPPTDAEEQRQRELNELNYMQRILQRHSGSAR